MRNRWRFRIVLSFWRLAVATVVLLVIGATWALRASQPDTSAPKKVQSAAVQKSAQQKAGPVAWSYHDQTGQWAATGTPPKCPEPLFSQSPVNTTIATAVLYPGQYRSQNYKPHGGFAFDGVSDSDVQVVMPMDAELNGLVRYIESGEIQYKVSFISDCGVAFYFDHLYALAADFEKIAEITPEPKVDDTRSTPFTKTIPFKAGDVIALASGHPATHNIALDFGVLDYRQQNEISKNAQWAALHQTYKQTEWYGVCWFDLLPADDAARIDTLPSRDQKSGVRSDYCANPLGNTMDVNGGNPV